MDENKDVVVVVAVVVVVVKNQLCDSLVRRCTAW